VSIGLFFEFRNTKKHIFMLCNSVDIFYLLTIMCLWLNLMTLGTASAEHLCATSSQWGRDLKADPNTPLFQHEYGHYLQSKRWGPLYIRGIGIPSLITTLGNSNNDYFYTEQGANRRAFKHFTDKYGSGGFRWYDASNPIRGRQAGIYTPSPNQFVPNFKQEWLKNLHNQQEPFIQAGRQQHLLEN
jgi:hypothetical protein